MSLYVFCPRPSQGALELVHALGARRLRRFDGQDFWNKKARIPLTDRDVIVCWGGVLPELDDVRVLNGLEKPLNKLDEWSKLNEHGVATIQIYNNVPKGADLNFLPRIAHHVGGRDLLVTPAMPDYYVVKENFVREFRIHSFAGRSIRAGIKVHRDGFKLVSEADWKPDQGLVHPWVRSFEAGWRVNYDGFQSTALIRKLAHSSVKSLGVTFGAVDIAETSDGKFKVLEVNRMPGIEGGSILAYVKAINRWVEAKSDTRGTGDGEVDDI